MPFKDIFGHDKEIEILRKALLRGRLAHSFIFIGPEGVGKRTTALALAKALNCLKIDGDFCGGCSVCRQIDSLSHPNVMMVEPVDGIVGIDTVRGLQDRLYYKASGGKKVGIIDGAEMMNREASNALLKTLEEPPSDSVIILITCEGSFLLPTVLSRCQRVNFRPLGKEVIARVIMERLGVTEERAGLLSTFSGGSLGRALRMEGILDGRSGLIERLEGLSLDGVEDLFKLAEEVSKGENGMEALEFLKIWYRDLLVYKEGRHDMVINMDLIPLIERHAMVSSVERLWEGFMIIHQAQRDMMPPRYGNRQLTTEVMLMELVGRMNEEGINGKGSRGKV